MNPDQKRHLATTLCLIEKDLRQEERLLRARGEKGILYEIIDPLSERQHQELLTQVAKLRECIALAKDRFGLEVEQTNLRQMLVGELMMLWVWLRETTTRKLKGYGAVNEELQHSLDPRYRGNDRAYRQDFENLGRSLEKSPRRRDGLW